MKFGTLLTEEREFVLRSLAFCGVHFVVSLSNIQGRFKISENELAEEEIKEIHVKENWQILNEKIEELGFKFKGILDGWHVFAPAKNVLHSKGFTGIFMEDDRVQLNMAYQNSPSGTLAVILYNEGERISIITDQYNDIIHLSPREAIDHLIFIS